MSAGTDSAGLDWQPISTAPSSEDQPAILFNGKSVVPGWRFEGRWIDVWYDHMDPQPTHWMPLPPPPSDPQ